MSDRGAETRTRLLDAAERLVAEQGIEATSLRAVTAAAGANLAAANYHFGSKEALIAAVYIRRMRPMNEERLRRLDALGQRFAVEDVLACFIEPAVQAMHGENGQVAVRLIGRGLFQPDVDICRLLKDEFQPLVDRFIAALAACLPGMPAAELHWRLFFTLGAMANSLINCHRVAEMSAGACVADDAQALSRRLVAFAAAGMRVPA